jgi:hypothetical protein
MRELVKFTIAYFVSDRFGKKIREFREKSPNLWEKSEFE